MRSVVCRFPWVIVPVVEQDNSHLVRLFRVMRQRWPKGHRASLS